MSFTIAIVGRPNVGKSTLFNRLVGKRLALVDDRPGVTRDRREGQARLGDLDFTIIDTAGLEDAGSESLAGRMLAQTKTAIEQADAVFFMLDARTGPVPDDRAFADLVRRSGKPVIVVANKAEGKASTSGVLEAYALGLGDPVAISAEHGEGLVDLFEALREALPEATAKKPQADDEPTPRPKPREPIRVAIVGRPNSGKSTLVNRLLGEDRLLTGPEAGITRDTIASRSAMAGQIVPPARHRGPAAAAAHSGEAGKAFGRRRHQRHPLCRSRGAADGCRSIRSRSRTCASPIWSSARAGRW